MDDAVLALTNLFNDLVLIQKLVPNVFIHLDLLAHVSKIIRVRCLYYFVELLLLR